MKKYKIRENSLLWWLRGIMYGIGLLIFLNLPSTIEMWRY